MALMALQAMVSDAVAASVGKADAACASDRRAAAFVFVVGRDVADAGMQPDRVVLDANERELGPQDGGVVDRVEVGPVGLDVAEEALESRPGRSGCRAVRSAARSRTSP